MSQAAARIRQSPAHSALIVTLVAMVLGMVLIPGNIRSSAARLGPLQAPTVVPTSPEFELVERSRFAGGGSRSLATFDDHLVMGVDTELRVVDVSDPHRPAVIGRIDLAVVVADISVNGHMAYVTVSGAPLQIVDLQDARQPRIVGQVAELTGGWELTAAGDILYVADGVTLRIVDARDPQHAKTVAEVSYPLGISSVWDVDWETGFVFISSRQHLFVFDVRDISQPALVATVDQPERLVNFSGIAIHDGLAYVGGQTAGLLVYDVTVPESPSLVTTMPPSSSGHSFQEPFLVGDETLAVPAFDGGLTVVDLADPRQPTIVGRLSSAGRIWKAVGRDGVAYVVGIDLGLLVVDLSDPTAPTQIAAIEDPAPVVDLVLADPWAIVLAGVGRLRIFDIADREHPREVNRVTMPRIGVSLALGDGALYVCSRDRSLTVFDVRNPATPKSVAVLQLRDPCSQLAALYQRLYVSGDDGLLVMDVSEPMRPMELGGYRSREIGLSAIAVDGRHFYGLGGVTDPDTMDGPHLGLIVLDIRTPASIIAVGQLDLRDIRARNFVLTENTITVGGFLGLWMVDVTTPSAPVILPTPSSLPSHIFTEHSYRAMAGGGDYVYAARSGSSLTSTMRVMDLHYRDQPQLLADYDLEGYEASLVRTDGNLVAPVMGYHGVTLLEQLDRRAGQPTVAPPPTAPTPTVPPTQPVLRAYLPSALRNR